MTENKPKILIVDNEIEICNLFKDFFDFLGYNSTFETDGEKVLRELEKYEYDLLFLDLKLDPISGMDILIKSKKLFPFSEVIVVTGYGTEETVLLTMHYGASSYIQKPISFSDIKVQTEEALAKRRFKLLNNSLRNAIPPGEKSLIRHFDNIVNLDKLSTFINLTIDIDMLGDSILNGVADILPGKYYSFFFYDKINKEMVFYSRNSMTKKIINSLEIKVKEAFEKLSNKVVGEPYNVRTSRIAVVSDRKIKDRVSEYSSIFGPILIENSICGVIGISDASGDLKDNSEDILHLISNRVAHVLANATFQIDYIGGR